MLNNETFANQGGCTTSGCKIAIWFNLCFYCFKENKLDKNKREGATGSSTKENKTVSYYFSKHFSSSHRDTQLN